MIRLSATLLGLIAVTGLCLSSCQTAGARTPAILENTDETTLSRVKSVLSDAVGRAQIRLGPEDLSTSSTLTVLPPRLGPNETHSVAMPVVFDLMTNGRSCFAVRRDTGADYRLDGVTCKASIPG